MEKTLKKLSEVFIVIDNKDESIVYVETSRLAAEKDIKEYCIEGNYRIQIERLYSDGLVWIEEF